MYIGYIIVDGFLQIFVLLSALCRAGVQDSIRFSTRVISLQIGTPFSTAWFWDGVFSDRMFSIIVATCSIQSIGPLCGGDFF